MVWSSNESPSMKNNCFPPKSPTISILRGWAVAYHAASFTQLSSSMARDAGVGRRKCSMKAVINAQGLRCGRGKREKEQNR